MALFLGVEGALYICLLALDWMGLGAWSTWVKYAAIVLCLLCSLRGARLVAAAMAFTVLADTLLLVLDCCYPAGVAVFCVVQALYLVRIRRAGGWRLCVCIGVRCALCAAGVGVLLALHALEGLSILAAVYFSQLLSNALESWHDAPQSRQQLCFAVGLTLFVGCDVCVGLHNLAAFVPVDAGRSVFQMAALGMWLFYLPSQVLLVLSGADVLRKE